MLRIVIVHYPPQRTGNCHRLPNKNTTLVGAYCASVMLLLLVISLGLTSADFITSSVRTEQLPFIEERLLKRLEKFVTTNPPEELLNKKRELIDRLLEDRPIQIELLKKSRHAGWHPNQVYHLIKVLVQDWRQVLQDNPGLAARTQDLQDILPDAEDLRGACRAIVRLQQVYTIPVDQAFTGNYSGFLGPPLSPLDAHQIGKVAFVVGYLQESQQWLEKAVTELKDHSTEQTREKYGPVLANVLGLLGRVYFFQNSTKKAQEAYKDGMNIDSSALELSQLKKVLESAERPSFTPEKREYQQNMSLFCSRPKDQRLSEIRPYHVCRYHSGLYVPYYRYKEEILMTSPFASLIYDVISDAEIAAFREYSKRRLQDGELTDGVGKGSLSFDYRASKLAWVFEEDFPEAGQLSNRIAAITGLNLEIRPPTENSTAEPFQVVNYGLGGHYYPHIDSFEQDAVQRNAKFALHGNRLATVLLYLSDVDMGGATVFLKAGISVAPIKGAILMWYNFEPSLEQHPLTYHAGCPVLKGHKWIANKWIWDAGNLFRRPCGLTPHSTHLEVERFLLSRK